MLKIDDLLLSLIINNNYCVTRQQMTHSMRNNYNYK